MPATLTVIIPCKNERENIRACITSAQQIADEVLVADSGSTDGTLEIARELGCRIIEREYGTSGDFKNWAIPQAAHEWIFILDADERITPELAAEVRRTMADPQNDGYWIHRLNYFMGHPIRFGPWRNDRCLRLFRRDLGRYVGPTDHAEVELASGTVGRLSERLIHYTCMTYAQYLPKLSRYAEVQAKIWQAEGKRPLRRHLLLRFPLRFLHGYILRLGFLDGLAGLQVCVLVAYLSWLKQACLWQLQTGRTLQQLDYANDLGSKPAAQAREATGTLAGSPRRPGFDFANENWRRKLSMRELRHRWTPQWLRAEARRHRRNVWFRRLGIQRCYAPPIVTRDPNLAVRSNLPFVVGHELLANPRMTFVQIGAYDGVGDDDLHDLIVTHKLRGLLVEPQPEAFARLEQTYAGEPQVMLLNAAIAEQDGTRELYCRRGEASMGASFDRGHLRKHGIADDEIVSQEVQTLTLESALRAARLPHVDLIQIDAEGYDWPIIRSIDLARLRPRVLRFEYRHMSATDADACLELLASHGYRFIIEERDIIAVRSADSMATASIMQRRSA